MSSGETEHGVHTPGDLYQRRLDQLKSKQAIDEAAEKQLGYSKLVVAFVTIAAAVVLLWHTKFLVLLLVPAGVFVYLAVRHENRLQQIRHRLRSITFYERGLARLQDRWAGTNETGERFLNPAHPYARDLDIFGPASLFELLCTARTRAGEDTLADWLLHPAPVAELALRHGAIADLKLRTDLREQLFCLGETVRAGVHPDALASWGERKPLLSDRSIRVTSTMLALLWIAGLIAWGAWGLGSAALAISALNLAWAHRIHGRWDEAADKIEEATHDLDILAGVLRLIDRSQFEAPKLTAIQARLRHANFAPSDAIRRLDRIVGYLENRRNPAMRLLDVLVFWSAQCVFRAERWQLEFGPHIREWLEAVGEFEALTALAAYAFEHPADVLPELVNDGPLFDAVSMAHPLLPQDKAIRNDVKFGDGLQLIVLSGPNMAGKSTFIRSVGVNAVLAQCGAPVRAASLKLSPLSVAASICVLDSLSGGTSRFYAEIQRLKVAEDLAAGETPVLFLMDELLSGTNSHDRLEGTRLIVRSLIDRGAIGIVSTHDLALAEIPATMPDRAVNCHFEDRLENGRLIFDYKLKPGVVKTSNALELMRSIGLGIQPQPR
ncbi:MutS-related protein [Occallatibacter savannae]|uniref:MutS-related protein n=1 Tax=Occallatibacter savannae TaxID=1002691 RepID=UPI000D69DC80|nr:DNA mismatch repair protein MutS [Occallatibacter savannae]